MNKSIVLFAYARADLVRDSIKSIISAEGSSEWKKILVQQVELDQVDQVIKEYEKHFDLVVRVKRQFEPALGNINFNRILGTSICFELFQSDIVLGIEDDTMIGYDSLIFIVQMVERYSSNRAFRGVNLGSLELKTAENLYTYSLLRFGLHGQAGVITRKTWKKFSMKKLLENISAEGWDSRFEFFIKSGFMVTPNASRLLDRGWDGTHAPTDFSHPYFEKQRMSWVGTEQFEIHSFSQLEQVHSWRNDAVNYRKADSLLYILRSTKIGHYLYKIWKSLKLPKLM